jgi:signal transduction histidine kinase
MIKKSDACIILFFYWSLLLAHTDRGIPLITNYHAEIYNGYAANWTIVQDQRGIMYFGNGDDTGNGDGILTYDGVTWNLIPLPNKTTVRSLAISQDNDSKIYVGAVDDFGYLEADSRGHLKYISLLAYLDEADRNFGDVWETYTTAHGVYFITQRSIFRWSDGQIQMWKPETRFHLSSVIRDTLYIRQWEVGLMRMEEDTLRLVPGGARFADERIYVILPFDEQRILIVTRTQGMFLFDGVSFKRFVTEIDNFLKQNEVYLPGAVLNNGTFAFGTMRGGLIIMDRQGNYINHIDAASGLQDETVFYIYQDKEGLLWLALNRGISKVDICSPLSFYTRASGIESTVFSIIRHKGILYIATGLGVYYLDPAQKTFNPVAGITSESWQMLSIENRLLAATFSGVYEIKNKTATIVRPSISYDYRARALYHSKKNTARVYIGLENGIASLRLNKGKWIDEGIIPGIHEEIQTIAETQDGNLWLGTNTAGILLLHFDAISSLGNPEIKRFTRNDGLPDGGISVFSIAGINYFSSNAGLYRFNEELKTFVVDTTFSGISNGVSSGNCILREDNNGNVWINCRGESAVAIKDNVGSYIIEKKSFLRFAKLSVYDMYPDENDLVWFGGPEGLIRYDKKMRKAYDTPFQVLIRRVTVGKDSLIFGGTLSSGEQKIDQQTVLPYSRNGLRFEFSATSFQAETENQYRTFLEGFDDGWSLWKDESKRDYTNLPSGSYRFHVLGKNVYGQLSNEAVFEFKILPPWYFTWPAFMVYGGLLIAGIFMVDKIQRKRVIGKERAKSQLREAELRTEAAEAQAKLITQEKLASLGALTAGVAHEIKNPLNFINNFAELTVELVKDSKKLFEKYKEKMNKSDAENLQDISTHLIQNAEKIYEHGKRADSIVRNMLQYSRSKSRGFQETDINAILEEDLNLAYHGMRAQYADFNVTIEKQLDKTIGTIEAVSQDISRVFLNVISNGFYETYIKWKTNGEQFTPILSVRSQNLGKEIEVRIMDNGNGIPASIRHKLFEPFFTTKPAGQGTGLGLSLSYDIIVKEHNGDLMFETEEGKFACFIIRLPRKVHGTAN